jgi:3-phenylpropionate/trans-cinnamate dioxygenase ferredoxin reductase component
MTGAGLAIVGSGPAGVGAAEAFRRHNSELPVLLVSADPAVPHEHPPLSKDFLTVPVTSSSSAATATHSRRSEQ